MIYTVNEREFTKLLLTRELIVHARRALAVGAYRALFEHWAAKIGPIDTAILGYLIARTLAHGRFAQRISVSEFTEHLAIGRTAIRQHLQDLAENGFIAIYRTEGSASGSEKEARMFEIDCNFVVDSVLPTLEKTEEMAPTPPQQMDPPGRETTTPSCINHGVDKSTLLSARSSRSGSQENNVLPIPKKPRATVARSESASEIIASISRKTEATATVRVTAAAAKAPHLLDKLELQALLDKAMKTYHPNGMRMIVTGKEFGVLRKRLKEQAPADFPGFINHIIGQWYTIAAQNGIARRKRIGDAGAPQQGSAMPMVPDFATLCYRYPYFAKVYANRGATGEIEQTPKVDPKVRALEQQLEASRRDTAILRERLSERKAPILRRVSPSVRPGPIARPPVAEDFSDVDLPAWDEVERKVK